MNNIQISNCTLHIINPTYSKQLSMCIHLYYTRPSLYIEIYLVTN